MQKAHQPFFFTLDFCPILHRLRTLHPNLVLTFNISFDTILEPIWNDTRWEDMNQFMLTSPPNSDAYLEMGFVDVSDLIALPTDEDRAYVAEHLADRRMPATPPLEEGLLSETPANRRVLGRHYVVKELALFRVLMREHYGIYVKCEKERKERAADATTVS
ncbi:hypothetical protein K458DRAFT_427268 [Lentithecium fluviatile CBS 122367]|uniref:Uncharacterized protein n=1 Tax=Lentithecium fluviatile CBS 122367 TaxID=1168545 RepID=A0A6G1JJE7_9PLEO|nr:hypothetical protein K458DRAFT_427268 [Lentithecium fluviatile CBS 122367]